MFRKTLIALAAATALTSPAFAADGDIVDTAAAAGSFETLLAAAEAAGLVDTLKSEGPFTVFAPTDEAFAALPEGTVESLLEPENQEQLANILLYHVVPGKVMSTDLTDDMEAPTALEGQSLLVDLDDGVT
ncbi:MAG: fasciclin domain-containing protein, partial [Pseudomonadota bacterium]